ncbi:MAG: hypothetical protein HY902_06240, partial [Deltaproteobacteria bacterium]|nr:hypothetical protein [Deltaproteobacteria bacterium]
MAEQVWYRAGALGRFVGGLTVLAWLAGCGGDDTLTVSQTNDSAAVQDQGAADAGDSATDSEDTASDDATDHDSVGSDGSGDDAAAQDAAGSDTPAPDSAPQCSSDEDCAVANPCLLGTCSAKGTCQAVAKADTTPCDDGNACTKADTCLAGVCTGGAAVACDDDNLCTNDKCNPLSGCLNLPVTATTDCDDGDPCTQGDACLAGKCEAGVNTCQCQVSSDCAKFEDGNLCNGSLYCNKSAGPPYLCKLNPASLVVCPGGADSACQKNTCIPATGACKLVVAPANTPCDDGDSCTSGDFCDSGLCQGGANTCACKQDADCAAQEDGNACNGTLFCNKALAQCQVNPITVVTCQTVDDTACLQNICNPKEGKCYLLPVHEGKACDDGNPCTPNETCSGGQCSTATNTCDCQSDADCAAKDDGNLCNGTLYCDVAAYVCRTNPASVVHCNTGDDPACLGDVCDPKSGKCSEIALPKDGTACDDGNPCTALSLCSGGKCQGQANLCQCQKDSDCAGKDDGDLCNGSLFCNPTSNLCEVNPATVVECPSAFDEACLTNQCDPKTGGCGMKPAHQGNQCDDDSLCSGGGWCALGTCEVTVKQACECQQDADCDKLDDGDLCNGTLYCAKTAGAKPICKANPATVVVCKTVDDTACSKAICQPKTGVCALTPISGPCSDGKACTVQDSCLNGLCAGLTKICSDGVACTVDSCQEPFGCVAVPGAPAVCSDGNACTGDACDLTKGCVTSPVAGACDDGNPCTVKDTCS